MNRSSMRGFASGVIICVTLLFAWQTASTQVITSGKQDGFDLNSLGLSKDTLEKLRAANESLNTAMEALKAEGKYTSATELPNATLILSGGGNSLEDLDRGMGVDPETYAMLYAGLASDEIKESISRDAEGRVLYKNRVVRIAPFQLLMEQAQRRKAVQNFNPFTYR